MRDFDENGDRKTIPSSMKTAKHFEVRRATGARLGKDGRALGSKRIPNDDILSSHTQPLQHGSTSDYIPDNVSTNLERAINPVLQRNKVPIQQANREPSPGVPAQVVKLQATETKKKKGKH